VKTLSKVVFGIVMLMVSVLGILRITGFNPHGPRAGLWLSGNLITAPITDWSFAGSYPTIELQTDTWYLIPHSVTIYCVTYQNHLYLQALGKMWNRNVVRDPHVRIKIGNQLYDKTVLYVGDPSEYWGVEQAMAKKYSGWTPSKNFISNAFLRVSNTN
jgi:hypothetical protein